MSDEKEIDNNIQEGDYALLNEAGKIEGAVTAAFFSCVVKYIKSGSKDISSRMLSAGLANTIVIIDSRWKPHTARAILKAKILNDDFITANGLNKDITEKLIDELVEEAYEFFENGMQIKRWH